MFRKLTLFALMLAATPVFSTVAHAEDPVTEQDLDLQKAEVKYDKATAKAVEKLASKWAKNSEKDKDNGEVEKELKEYYKNELSFLRAKGVETKDEEQHPAHPDKVVPAGDDKPKLEELRDMIVDLKAGDIKDKKYGEKLDKYVKALWERHERAEKAYEKAKEKA